MFEEMKTRLAQVEGEIYGYQRRKEPVPRDLIREQTSRKAAVLGWKEFPPIR